VYERQTRAVVHLDALADNVKEIKGLLSKKTKFCAVVKADAYGHGAIPAAKAVLAAGADMLAVAIVNEAIELREAGITAPILILGHTPSFQASLLVSYGITQAVFSFEMAEALSRAAVAAGTTAKIHLKIDTGMSRIGIVYKKAGAFAAEIANLPGLEIEGAFSHFATADSTDKTYALHQFDCFQIALQQIERNGIKLAIRHIANSAAIIDMPETHLDMVRAGIILYGLWPSAEVNKKIPLKATMHFKTCVTYLKEVPAGTPISYGCTYKTDQPRRIATLPVGYADGWPRSLSNKAQVWLHGRKVPLVGRICMDQCMIDVTQVPEVRPGDEVILFGGPELPADEVAAQIGTISYELVCMVSKRVPRQYSKHFCNE